MTHDSPALVAVALVIAVALPACVLRGNTEGTTEPPPGTNTGASGGHTPGPDCERASKGPIVYLRRGAKRPIDQDVIEAAFAAMARACVETGWDEDLRTCFYDASTPDAFDVCVTKIEANPAQHAGFAIVIRDHLEAYFLDEDEATDGPRELDPFDDADD